MLRTRSFAAVFAAVALILTTPGAVLAQDEEAASPAASPGTMSVPFEGVFVGTANFAPVDPPTDACPMVRTIVDATGHTTIGTVTVHAEHCPAMAPGIPSAPGGTMTMTTESGDSSRASTGSTAIRSSRRPQRARSSRASGACTSPAARAPTQGRQARPRKCLPSGSAAT